MDESVRLFMEVTKVTNEKEAKEIIKTCQGNLEEAISTYLSKVDFQNLDEVSTPMGFPEDSQGGVRQRRAQEEGCKDNICERSGEKIERTNFLYILNHIGRIICPLFKNICNIITTCFKLLSTYILSSDKENTFTMYYENMYGEKHVNFFKGTLSEAINKSKKEEKLLLVYLHIENNESSYFCNSVFNNEDIKLFFDENCILYAQDISTGDIKELSDIMNVFILPQISIILTCYVKEYKELSIIYGTPDISHIINCVTHCIEQMQMKKENINNLKNKNYNDRLIREEQDREYQEALRKDKLKEEEKKKKENEKFNKLELKKDIKKKRQEKINKFPLPIKENEQVTKICIRLPNGIKIQNNFSVNHTLEDVYDWAECYEFLADRNSSTSNTNSNSSCNQNNNSNSSCNKNNNSNSSCNKNNNSNSSCNKNNNSSCNTVGGNNSVSIPYKFELICGHTKSVLQKTKNKIKEYDLYPNAVLNMKSKDSSDEE
ncbi:UBX domain, putative [Plasmodium malariae]|uniref:UBX domain, putative n=1 Tax=Plasmodium malariae TaxID=5858 RepID=A0A1C3KC23_PLAMA|nr:UBX domain, putative [Plasmodium malariae]